MRQFGHCFFMATASGEPPNHGGDVSSDMKKSASVFSLLESDCDVSDVVTEEELRLIAEWPVHDLVSLLNDPETRADMHADDFIRFHERAGRVMEALLGHIQPDILTVRFGVGGVIADLNVPFNLTERFLEQLWRYERPISHWVRKQSDELTSVALLGRPYALADATISIREISGMSRFDAIENQCYDAYLRQIYLRAFNLYGVYPVALDDLGVRGVDPWMQVAAGRDIRPAYCTGRQLQLFARRSFRDFKIPFELFSILKHLPLLLPASERLKITDWRALLQEELSASWLRGETGEWIEAVIELLDLHEENQLIPPSQLHIS